MLTPPRGFGDALVGAYQTEFDTVEDFTDNNTAASTVGWNYDQVRAVRALPPRERLARFIERTAEATEAAEKIRASIRVAERWALDAEGRGVRAGAEIEKAREEQTVRIAEAAAGGKSVKPDSSLRKARIEQAEAEDELAAAREALTRVRAPLASHEDEEVAARADRDRAAEAVLVEGLPQLNVEAEALVAELVRKAWVLDFLRTADRQLIPSPERREAVQRADVIASNAFMFSGALTRHAPKRDEEITAPWKAALAALLTDADAKLPA